MEWLYLRTPALAGVCGTKTLTHVCLVSPPEPVLKLSVTNSTDVPELFSRGHDQGTCSGPDEVKLAAAASTDSAGLGFSKSCRLS